MTTLTFDTLKFVEKLEAGGFSHQQAKAAAEAFAEATGQELVAKADLREMELRIDVRFAQLDGAMTLLKWMMGILLAGVASLVIKSFFG